MALMVINESKTPKWKQNYNYENIENVNGGCLEDSDNNHGATHDTPVTIKNTFIEKMESEV